MDSEKVYISRKKKLLSELRALGSTPFEASVKGWAEIAAKLCSILSRFDLGEDVDSVVEEFTLDMEQGSPLEGRMAKFHKVLCVMYAHADEFKDYSTEPTT